MLKGYKVKNKPIRHDGERYLANDFISEELISHEHAKRLISMNAIEKATKDEEDEVVITIEGVPGAGTLDADNEPVEVILDVNFEYAELVEDAKEELKLDFKGNISKKALIDLIIDSGHAQYFLNQLDD